MGEVHRAQNVCQTCALRKKACDKSLPACGFCAKKNVFCNYEILKSREGGGRRKYHPGRNFVAIPSPPSSGGSVNEVETRLTWVDPLFPSGACPTSSYSLDKHVHQRACQLIHATGLTPEDVGHRYFRAVDRSLPIISPELFHQVTLRFGATATPPPASYSLLLLGMLLVIGLPELKTGLQSHSLDRESIYLTVKALLSQTQAVICTSLQLIQAAFLIAVCEYSSGRPEIAYVSMVSCIGMARILGVGEAPSGMNIPSRVPGEGFRSRSMEMEVMNVSWAIATLERIILCETQTQQRHLRPLTKLPSVDSRICSDLQQSQVLNAEQRHNIDVLRPVRLLTAYDVENQNQQAQAISLLDQVLCVTSSAEDDKQGALLSLAKLDDEIHTFLGAVLGRDWKTPDAPSTSVALAIRLLFLLHGTVLDDALFSPTEIMQQQRMKSLDTLDSASNMVVDITRYRRLGQIDNMMPICCYYNLRISIDHLQTRTRVESDGIQSLLDSEKQYRRRWCFG